MAVSTSSSCASLLNSLSSLSLSSSPPPPPIAAFLSSASSSCSAGSSKTLEIRQTLITPVIREVCPDIQSVLFPSVAFSNTLYFKPHFNIQVYVQKDEPEESVISRFRRAVFKANVIQECKRRRFFETNQEKRKRKVRDAARRRARARRQSRPMAKEEKVPRKKVVYDEHDDNWGPIDGEIPYCK